MLRSVERVRFWIGPPRIPFVENKRLQELVRKVWWTAVGVCAATAVTSFTISLFIPLQLTYCALMVSAVVLPLLLSANLFCYAASFVIPFLGNVINHVKSLMKSSAAIVPAVLAYPGDLAKYNPKQGTALERPILFVHGYLHNSTAWIYHKAKLEQRGYKSIFTINLGSPFQSIQDYAEKVAAEHDKIKKITGRSDITLVGHSMGGLVCSYYATAVAPKGSVREVVTLGSPLQGTSTAHLAFFGKCGEQMKSGSSFIRELAVKIAEASHITFYTVASKADMLIYPRLSALLEEEYGHIEVRIFEDMGHLQYLYSNRINDMIVDMLGRRNGPDHL